MSSLVYSAWCHMLGCPQQKHSRLRCVTSPRNASNLISSGGILLFSKQFIKHLLDLCKKVHHSKERGTEHQHEPLCVELRGLVGEHEEPPSDEHNHQHQCHPLGESKHKVTTRTPRAKRLTLPVIHTIALLLYLCFSCTYLLPPCA